MKKTFLSLFSGCGGLDLGFIQAGYQPVAAVEIDEFARQSHEGMLKKHNIKKCPIFEDINELSPEDLMKQLNLSKGELDVLCGGPPCQSFSMIGKRKSVAEPRGMLLYKMVEFAKELAPKVVLIEQVKGLLSAKGLDGEKGGAFYFLLNELEKCGYKVNHSVLRAADYGVPQLRDRLFVVATLKNVFEFPQKTHLPEKKFKELSLVNGYKPYLTLGEAMKDLPSPTLKTEPELIPNHIDITPQGDRNRIHGVPTGDYLARQLHLPESQRGRLHPKKDTTKFRRMDWSKPSLTIRGGECFYHPEEDRYLTPRECLRIHGYPDDYVLVGPVRGRSGQYKGLDQHRQVANSVPPPLAKVLAKKILSHI